MSYLEDLFKHERRKSTSEQSKKEVEKNLHEQRQKVINYKKFFGEEHGKEVMLDIMNRFYMHTPETTDPVALARAVGRRDVIEYLLARANVSVEQLDKILKGEFV